ncbi:MAG: hypothetical protein IJ551_12150 [Prevotella sp.]|nr:hypothetical protein [Prevotella sp.]
MKRLLFLALSLFAMMGVAWADHWTVATPSTDQPTETYVYAILQVPSAAAADMRTNYVAGSDAGSKYEIAAFIDGEVRAVETEPKYPNPAIQTNVEMSMWRFNVKGVAADLNKSIVFKVYNKESGLEYDVDATATFTGETEEAVPSNPLLINLREPTSMQLEDFTLNVGETKDLLEVITFFPEGSAVPNNLVLEAIRPEADKYTIDNNVFTAVGPGTVPLLLKAGSLQMQNAATVTILAPATNLELKEGESETTAWLWRNGAPDLEYSEYLDNNSDIEYDSSVEVAEERNLNAFLQNCYTITPANSTDAVTWTSANPDVVEIEDGTAKIKGKGDVELTGTANGHSITVTVHVKQHVTLITSPFRSDDTLYCLMGDDLTPYFVDGKAFSVLPANADNKNVTFSFEVNEWDPGEVEQGADGTLTAKHEGTVYITVKSTDNPDVEYKIWVVIFNEVQDVTIESETLTVKLENDELDITEMVMDNMSFTPSPADFYYSPLSITSDNEDVVSVEYNNRFNPDDTSYLDDYVFTAKSAGTATITVEFMTNDHLAQTFGLESYQGVQTVTKTFTIKVGNELTGIELQFNGDDLLVDNGGEIYLTTQPVEGIELDLDKLDITASLDGFDGWTPLEVTDIYSDGDKYIILINPFVPGSITVTAHYDNDTADGLSFTTDPQNVGVSYEFTEGWEWRNIYFGNDDYDLTNLFGEASGNGLVEIRTENEEMLNDEQYGYFGDLDLLAQNRCFKIKTNENMYFDMLSGSLGQIGDINLHYGWNWIPNPFFFNRKLTNAFTAFEPTEGDRIMSKDEGFADYSDGAWVGSLDVLTRGQGYLYFSASQAEKLLNFADESQMAGEDDDPSTDGARRKTAARSSFTYDASRFRDNMGIVAELSDVQRPEDYSVVAFVTDECRGEGVCVGGRMFITVHANQGEQISFRLLNNLTGEMFDIDQTVRFGAMLGSMKAPFRMTSEAVVTGISSVQSSDSTTQSYDLSGRKVNTKQRGVNILHSTDGKVRKQVVK